MTSTPAGADRTGRQRPARHWALAAFGVDALFVVAFVLIGRSSHDEDPLGGMLLTLWPFLAGLVLGWAVARAWRAPLAIVRTALPVWAVTVAAGMLLRLLADQGVQPSFVIVTALVLAAFLLGWRALGGLAARVRSRGRAAG